MPKPFQWSLIPLTHSFLSACPAITSQRRKHSGQWSRIAALLYRTLTSVTQFSFLHLGLCNVIASQRLRSAACRVPRAQRVARRLERMVGAKRAHLGTMRPLEFSTPTLPGGIATMRPSLPCKPTHPLGMGTILPSWPCKPTAPEGIATMRPSRPCKPTAPEGIATMRPSRP